MKRLSDRLARSLWFRQKEREAREERKGSSERCSGYKCLSRPTYTPAARVPPHSMNTKEGESRNVLQRTKKYEQFRIETFGDNSSVSALMHGVLHPKDEVNRPQFFYYSQIIFSLIEQIIESVIVGLNRPNLWTNHFDRFCKLNQKINWKDLDDSFIN